MTYERLGAELDSDLQVLCLLCHETETIQQTQASESRIYLKLASEALRERSYADIGELSEAVKRLCAKHHVSYDGAQIHRALELLIGTRFQPKDRRPRGHEPEATPNLSITAAEAHEILRRLNLGQAMDVLVKSMPLTEKTPQEQAAHEAKIREQSEAMVPRRQKPKRPSLRARLEAIFEGNE